VETSCRGGQGSPRAVAPTGRQSVSQSVSLIRLQSERNVHKILLLNLSDRSDRGFESHSRHGCLCVFILCVGSGLVTG
jgi:hypothetical protein